MILNKSFESLKYIQEYYMISNCLHVIWINYYLDSYVVENLCMENVFWIYILIYNTYIYLSFIHFSKKIFHVIYPQMYLLFLFLCLLLNVVLQHTSLYYYVLCTIQVQRHVCGHALFVLFLSENDGWSF